LHLFTDTPEEVAFTLLDRGIPWQDRVATLRFGGDSRRSHPMHVFFAGKTRFEVIILPLSARANPPLDPISERPERGAGTKQVARLLGNDS
jgi:hypothetical protein